MIRTKDGKIILFIQEPEEEMAAIRFVLQHRPFAKKVDYILSLTDQAKLLGLKGGYAPFILDMLWQTMQNPELTFSDERKP